MSEEFPTTIPESVQSRTGKKYSHLTAIRFLHFRRFPSGQRTQMWEFLCDCGNRVICQYPSVQTLHVQSCKKCGRKRASASLAENVTGQYFGKLRALRRVSMRRFPNGDTKAEWEFQCACGTIVRRLLATVKASSNSSCGKCVTDVSGKTWNRLTAVKFSHWATCPSGNRRQMWKFLCSCGQCKTISLLSVVHGKTRSCGCLLKEYRKKRGPAVSPHDMYIRHREKRLAFAAQYRKRTVEQRRQYQRDHADVFRLRESKKRALRRSSCIKPEQIDTWLARLRIQKQVRCYYCQKIIPRRKLDIDHVMPLMKNGPHMIENLAATCRHCNRSKSYKTLKEWTCRGQQFLCL